MREIHVKSCWGRRHELGSALLLVLVLGGAALLIRVGMLSWSRTNTDFAARNNQYFRTLAAAEAATEKVVANVGTDYQNLGVPLVVANLDSYRATVPMPSESSVWNNYEFLNEDGLVAH